MATAAQAVVATFRYSQRENEKHGLKDSPPKLRKTKYMNKKNPIFRNVSLPSPREGRGWASLQRWGWALFLFLTLTACGNNDEDTTKKNTDNEKAATISDDYEYELPVVFHVLYKDANDALQNPKQTRLSLIIDSVNALYKRNGMNITFKMATDDENGRKLEEPGVIRHPVDFDDYDSNDFLQKNSKYAEYTQNLRKFINIYLFKFKESKDAIVRGISVMPVMTKEHQLEGLNDTTSTFFNGVRRFTNPWGICINNIFIDQSQKWGYVNPNCAWSTLAHELGHYIGLFHTFSEEDCEGTDYCSDTKSCNYQAYMKTIEDFLKGLSDQEKLFLTSFYDLPPRTECQTGEDYYADNIMDYIYTLCSNISKEQRARTRHVLNYCPLMPGLKKEEATTRAGESPEPTPTLFRPRLSNCPPARHFQAKENITTN